jgi:hypothetical protein
MGTNEEFLLRPVHRGMLNYTDLIDERVHLEDVIRCNAYLDCVDENEARANEAARK